MCNKNLDETILKKLVLDWIYNWDLPKGLTVRLVMKLSFFDRIKINAEEISSKYRFYKYPTRPYIFIYSKVNRKHWFSLNPLQHELYEDCQCAFKLLNYIGDSNLPSESPM